MEEYEPYGEEWVKEMMKWKKIDLIEFLKKVLIKLNTNKSEKQIKQLEERLK